MNELNTSKLARRLKSSVIKFITQYPCVTLSLCLIVSSLVAVYTFWFIPIPNFTDPIKDVTPRGTKISDRRIAKEKLNQMLEYKSLFTISDMVNFFGRSDLSWPEMNDQLVRLSTNRDGIFRRSKSFNNFALIKSSSSNHHEDIFGDDDDEDGDDDLLANILSSVESKLKKRHHNEGEVRERRSVELVEDDTEEKESTSSSLEFDMSAEDKVDRISHNSKIFVSNCEPILTGIDENIRIIMESKEAQSHSILSLEFLSLQCQLIEYYLKPYVQTLISSSFDSKTASATISQNIRFESLSNLVTRFSRKMSCSDLEEADVRNFTLVLGYCTNIYRKLAVFDFTLDEENLDQEQQLRILPICRDRIFIDAYKYLIDRDFYFRDGTDFNQFNLEMLFSNKRSELPEFQDQAIVQYTSIYFSVNKNDTKFLIPFFSSYLEPNFLNKPMENRYFEIVGVNFDIKIDLFNSQISTSAYDYLIISLCLVFISSLIYTRNLLLSLALLISIAFALAESYLIQKLLIKDDNFSFLHLCSIFMLVLTSFQSVYLLIDVWSEAKLKFKSTLLIDNQLDIVDPTTSIHLKNKIRSVAASNRRNFDLVGAATAVESPNFESVNGVGSGGGGVGSDDKDDVYLENCVSYLFRNVGYSIMICSLSRLVCLGLNLNSSIVSIKYFAFFGVLICFFYFITSITIFTCCLVIQQKYMHKINVKSIFSELHLDNFKWIFKAQNAFSNVQYVYQSVFEMWLPTFIINFRCAILAVLVIASIPGIFLLFVRPSIQLTQTAACIRLFADSSPLEVYDHRFSEFAAASTSSEANNPNTGIYPYQQDMIPRMRVSFVFGLRSQNIRGANSYRRRPWEINEIIEASELDFDKENFDFYDQRAQLWFLNFCKALKKEFKKPSAADMTTSSSTSSNENEDTKEANKDGDMSEEDWENLSTTNLCLIDLLRIVFTRRCSNDQSDFVNNVCCEQTFPFDSNVLQLCLRNSTFLEKYLLPYQSFLSEQLYFNKTNGVVVALEIKKTTHHKWTSNYKKMSQIHSELDQFFKKQIDYKFINLDKFDKTEMKKNLFKNAFFESEFEFFDFQKSLLSDTLQSLLASHIFTLILVFVATFNFPITIFSVLTLIFCQSSSLGVLILLGWQIDLLESIGVVLSTAVCFDSILHLAIQYTKFIGNSNDGEQEFVTTIFFIREHTVKNIIGRIGSALTISTLVVILTSVWLSQSTLAVFRLYAVYFGLLTVLSLIYGLFMFIPLCASFGPLTNYCRIIRSNKRSEKSFIEFKRANRTIKNVRNKLAHATHTTAI